MLVEIVKWGNSTAVRLPAAILKRVRVALLIRVQLASRPENCTEIEQGVTDDGGNQAAASAPELAGNSSEKKRSHGGIGAHHDMNSPKEKSYQ